MFELYFGVFLRLPTEIVARGGIEPPTSVFLLGTVYETWGTTNILLAMCGNDRIRTYSADSNGFTDHPDSPTSAHSHFLAQGSVIIPFYFNAIPRRLICLQQLRHYAAREYLISGSGRIRTYN